jgi:outer membrane protein OmpA-like peptidoglycan-associated protein
MKQIARFALAALPMILAATPALADDPAWYAGKYYDPDNSASATGFTSGYQLYRTIGCPGKQLLDAPCAVPPPPPAPAPVVQAPEPAPVTVVTVVEPPPAPPPVAEAPKPAAVLTKEKPLVLKDVNFRFNHYDLMPAAHPILDQAATGLKEQHFPKVMVDGFTDDIGTVKYNLWLSRKRAETVKNYLVKDGVPADALATKGYGKTHFVASNHTAAGRFENRRVELHIE